MLCRSPKATSDSAALHNVQRNSKLGGARILLSLFSQINCLPFLFFPLSLSFSLTRVKQSHCKNSSKASILTEREGSSSLWPKPLLFSPSFLPHEISVLCSLLQPALASHGSGSTAGVRQSFLQVELPALLLATRRQTPGTARDPRSHQGETRPRRAAPGHSGYRKEAAVGTDTHFS